MAGDTSQLIVEVRPGDQLILDDKRITVEFLDKSGKLARLRVTAQKDVKIEREACDQPRAMRD